MSVCYTEPAYLCYNCSMNHCSEDGCTNSVFSHVKSTTLCQGHYRSRSGKKCTFDGCEKSHRAMGYCDTHYGQYRDGLELKPIGEYRVGNNRGPKICSHDGCERPVRARGLCAAHRRHQIQGRELGAVGERSHSNIFGDCDLCGEHRELNWDHDHETGEFRGWLCTPCNTALGRLGDNAEGLQRALDYVSRT